MKDNRTALVIKRLKLLDEKVLKFNKIKSFLDTNRTVLGFSKKFSTQDLIEMLVGEKILTMIELNLGVRKEKRFLLGQPTPCEVALLIRSNSYFTHQTALYLNGFKTEEPKIIYVNSEQPRKYGRDDELMQESIDDAFRVEQRQSKSLIKYKDKEIMLLSGMNTSQLGVIEADKDGVTLRYTDLERTLIDITVRPAYSGGVSAVLDAYAKASTNLSMTKLNEYLRTLNYKYPYHQAIGFYLEQTGKFSSEDLLPMRRLGLNYNFYLAHGMKQTRFNQEWRIYYPEDLPTRR